jgi:alpha-tubulin suppressor-like RCC1 family protein
MPPLDSISSPTPSSCRGGRGRRLARRLSPTLAVLLVAALGCREDAESPTAPAPTPALAAGSTQVLAFRQVSAGFLYTCGVTTDDRAYCWGGNEDGQLGDGTTTQRLTPVAVAGGRRFRHVSVRLFHACGVTTDNRAYCWGRNDNGQLGDGTTTRRLTPTAVAGGRQFRQVDAGSAFTCALGHADSKAYCWGANGAGMLGDGTTIGRLTPRAVAGGRQFRQVSAGHAHGCGVTPSNQAFCWGQNASGQLGDGSDPGRSLVPVLVAGGHPFRQVDAGFAHTCAVTTTDRAFCWGNGRSGQIGDGKTFLRFTPRRVVGGLLFDRVSTGEFHSCGETTGNRAYCWGSNNGGQLGDGTMTQRLTPVAVVGGLTFSQLSPGVSHTCGVTRGGSVYCWGDNVLGQLGDGTTTFRLAPVAVAGTT